MEWKLESCKAQLVWPLKHSLDVYHGWRKWPKPVAKTVTFYEQAPKVDVTYRFSRDMFSFVFVIIFFEYAGCSTDSSNLWKPPAVHRVFLTHFPYRKHYNTFSLEFFLNSSVCIRLVIWVTIECLTWPLWLVVGAVNCAQNAFVAAATQLPPKRFVARSNSRQSKPRMAFCSTKDEAKILFCFAVQGELSNTLLQCPLILAMLSTCIPLCKGQGCLNIL